MAAELDIDKLYRKHAHAVLRRAHQILGSMDEAREVLQDLFKHLMERPDRFDGRSAPLTFLYAATTNACLSRLRDRRNRHRLIDEQVRPWTTEIDPRSPEAAAAVRGMLAQLTDDEARAVIYVYLDGMSYGEVAGMLGCSRRHIGDLLYRVSRQFGELAEPAEPQEAS
jgi:RNA polymerase sigma factor (sigma-70 family)